VDPDFTIDSDLADLGAGQFGNCSGCHGWGMYSGGNAPDLRASIIPLELEAFKEIVQGGARVDKGMPAFPEITDEELKALQHYIRRRAKETLPEYEAWEKKEDMASN
jgi:quinohemoprotein ethanol dehydrogenase